jgi:hypothetical protein
MAERSFEETAASKVDWWRANDGGLTMAAEDMIWFGGTIDRLFTYIEEGKMTAQEVQDYLYERQFSCRTGTEADIVGEALEYLYERYIKPSQTS